MQLNLFSTLNSLGELSLEKNYSLLALNGKLATNILESQMAFLKTTLSASSSVLTQRDSPAEKFSLMGALTNDLFDSGRTSMEMTMKHISEARPEYEQWAISTAGMLGEMMNTMTGLNQR